MITKFTLWLVAISLIIGVVVTAATYAALIGIVVLAGYGIYKGIIYYKNTKYKKEEEKNTIEQEPSTDN